MWWKKENLVALAPMSDLTDTPFSRICRLVADADFVIFKEMVSAEAIIRESKKTLQRADFLEEERPVIIQIFGGEPQAMVGAAQQIVAQQKPEGIDINMGCPVPKIAGKAQAGASLLRDPQRAIQIVSALKKADLGVTISVKTRLGWSDPKEIIDFAPQLEQAGADLLTIHGRTKSAGYTGQADWSAIAAAVSRVKIPVLANGDITSLATMRECLDQTGATGVMVGRAVLGNPWLLRELVQGKNQLPTLAEIKDIVFQHAQYHLDYYGQNFGLASFRRHLLFYFSGFPGIKKVRSGLAKTNTLADLKAVLSTIRES
ncbi:MAG TPA: tRNA-dihydrouridine synthase [Patescibacteria group bacterium]|nr:tRNA-dihydrouridine synthase [Patescibacteria group bacterium]